MRPVTLALATLALGCAARRDLGAEYTALSGQVSTARAQQAASCAPVDFARAETQLAFARVEFAAADPRRAQDHLDAAKRSVEVALTASSGCAERDQDGDGVPDIRDACPDEAGTGDDGCPDADDAPDTPASEPPDDEADDTADELPSAPASPSHSTDLNVSAEIDGGRITVSPQVRFDGDTLTPEGVAVLQTVADLIVITSDPLRVRVHVDGTGDLGADHVRSELRAMAIRAAFISAGLDPDRLILEAVGASEPVDTNRTASGREANQRVEFLLQR